MTKTKKEKRIEKRKTLIKQLKEQKINAKKITNKIKRIEKQLWKLELKNFKDAGLLQKLSWEFEPDVQLFGTHATGLRSKETTEHSLIAQKIERWSWKHHSDRTDDVEFFVTDVNGYKIILALKLEYENEDTYDYFKIVIFAADIEETGTGREAEETAIEEFVDKWELLLIPDFSEKE